MKQKKVWRFYCDHCKKAGGGKRAMETHERHCTLNPERECRVCALVHGAHPRPMPELIAALNEGGYKKLREASSECPACILARLRQIALEQCQ